MTILLQTEQLSVKYGAIEALKGININIRSGEIVSLIGNNGAGKTTLLKTISGLLNASSGQIFFADKTISKLTSHEIVQLGICQSPEGRMVFPDMNVQENLLLGAWSVCYSKKELQERLDQMIAWFPRLGERMKQKAVLLSGGEQQMLAIARALMAKPRLLLLDEPSLGIAPLIVQQIFKIIELLNKEGTTILLAEQNAHLALKVSHRAYVLELGEIVMEGNGLELLHNEDIKRAYLGV